ncbi:hypothetical protein [Halorarius litoreus]|uniref:hypothetical protein n=1 Tax=Halorarius litoreus TaxID=2962676 RepID=UPI0020CDF6B9|nr:hypothetical protein [Halorarius litoreus]
MRYLVFTNTPKHVHVYKYVVRELERRGHDVLILARDYGCTIDLLDWYDLPYEEYGTCGTSKYSLFRRLPGHYARIIRSARRFAPDFIFGYGAYAAHAGLLTGATTVLVTDSEVETLDMGISRPFVDAILTPYTYGTDLGSVHYTFNGFNECAYLHPEVFSSRPDVRDWLGIGDDPFVLLRFNAFGSHHDVGVAGFTPSQRRRLIEQLADSVTVFVSDEGGDLDFADLPARPYDAHPALLHDVLAEAELLVADTQTMVTEAALLGTPAIRSNSFAGGDDMGNFLELERQGLISNFAEFDAVLSRARLLLEGGEHDSWLERRDSFMADKVNLTDLLVEIALAQSVNVSPRLSARAATSKVG